MVASSDNFVEDQDQQIRMGTREHGYVHWYGSRVGFVQANAKVPLSAQEQKDKDAYVYKTNTTLICSGFVQVVQNRCLQKSLFILYPL